MSVTSSEPTAVEIWGGGYVGLSSALHYAAAGLRCLVRDVDPRRVEAIQGGEVPLPQLEDWVGIRLKPYVETGLITATDADAPPQPGGWHLVAVPTEIGGTPTSAAVHSVLNSLDGTSPQLCLVESTLTPGSCAALTSEHQAVPLALAPRRDWFLGAGRDIASLPRVFAGATQEAHIKARAVLGIVSPRLVPASTCEIVELTKCIENSLHHVSAMYATQLARAYPGDDVAEALRLAATHWRINNIYFASAGTGGYCLPVSTQHLLRGADLPDALTIASAAASFESNQRDFVADLLAGATKGPIAILGVTYRGDVPSITLSPFWAIAGKLSASGRDVRVYDPYYTDNRLSAELGASALVFPDGLAQCGAVFVGPRHRLFTEMDGPTLLSHLRPGQLVLDNEGTWHSQKHAMLAKGVVYRQLGEALPFDTDHAASGSSGQQRGL